MTFELAGRYVVNEMVGRGGMATVHRATDTRLERTVAVKLLRSDVTHDSRALHRFRREAQNAARLSHPTIVGVFDSGEDRVEQPDGSIDTTPYIIMEFVDGISLRDMVRNNPPSIEASIEYTARILSALQYSHDMGIIHRDIKPGNVMINSVGDLKVMDFGIARALNDAGGVTQSSAVLGTAAYFSPEQAQGHPVDARSDLYSTGCLLYELLTGRTPFEGDNAVSVAFQHVRHAPLPPSQLNPAVPEPLDRIVLQALSKRPEDRYQTANDFCSDLRAFQDGDPVMAQPVPFYIDEPTQSVTVVQQYPGNDPTQAHAASAQRIRPGGVPGDVYVDGQVRPGYVAVPTDQVFFETTTERRREPQSRSFGYFVLTLAVLTVLGAGFFAYTQLFEKTETTETQTLLVPSVVGKTVDEARAELDKAGLTLKESTPETSDQDPGTVLSQVPPPRTVVNEGSTVSVIVSSGPQAVAIPNVAGSTEEAARNQLIAIGLKVESETIDDGKVSSGLVVATAPAAGVEIAPGSTVSLKVSSGKVVLPDLVGVKSNDAIRTLISLGLNFETQQVVDNSVAIGEVAKTSPQPGRIDQGSQVKLHISASPKPGQDPTPTNTPTAQPTETTTPEPTETTTQPTVTATATTTLDPEDN